MDFPGRHRFLSANHSRCGARLFNVFDLTWNSGRPFMATCGVLRGFSPALSVERGTVFCIAGGHETTGSKSWAIRLGMRCIYPCRVNLSINCLEIQIYFLLHLAFLKNRRTDMYLQPRLKPSHSLHEARLLSVRLLRNTLIDPNREPMRCARVKV